METTRFRAAVVVVGLLVFPLLPVFSDPTSAAASLPQGRDVVGATPVMVLHGLHAGNSVGLNAAHDYAAWKPMRLAWEAWYGDQYKESSREIVFWGYYECDQNWDFHVDGYGSHETYLGPLGFEHNHAGTSCHTVDGHDASTTIEHLAYHWAWGVYREFTEKGRCVDVVTKSMGGLILRYAMAQVERRHEDFPPEMCVEDAVTLVGPHAGSDIAESCTTYQCYELRIGSPFVAWLTQNAKHPQSRPFGTDWTVIGSYDDTAVTGFSAMFLDAPLKIAYSSSPKDRCGDPDDVGHTDVTDFISDCREATVTYQVNGGPTLFSSTAPSPVRAAYYSLVGTDALWLHFNGETARANRGPKIQDTSPPLSGVRLDLGEDENFEIECVEDPDDDGAVVGADFNQETYAVLFYDGIPMEIEENLWGFDDLDADVTFREGGLHEVAARCQDALASESDDRTWDVNVRVPHPPTLTRLGPADDFLTVSPGSEKTFHVEARDDDADLDQVLFFVDGSTTPEEENDCYIPCRSEDVEWEREFPVEGTFTITAVAEDDTGRRSFPVSWTVLVSWSPPTLATRSPASRMSIEPGQSITFSADANDPDGDMTTTVFTVGGKEHATDDKDIKDADSRYDYVPDTSIRFALSGSYLVEAFAKDKTGRTSQRVSWTVTVATLPGATPAIKARGSTSLTVGEWEPFSIKARVDDADGDIDWTYIERDGAYWTSDGCYTSCTYDEPSATDFWADPGTHTYRMLAYDKKGHSSGWLSFTVRVVDS